MPKTQHLGEWRPHYNIYVAVEELAKQIAKEITEVCIKDDDTIVAKRAKCLKMDLEAYQISRILWKRIIKYFGIDDLTDLELKKAMRQGYKKYIEICDEETE